MYYVVGWPDLPAACVAILATKIYDYVSPRTVEDWEYTHQLAKDREREEQIARAARKKVESAKSRLNAPTAIDPAKSKSFTPALPGRKKRGRPSKSTLHASRLVQQTSAITTEVDVQLPPTSTSGPSLSTPQKKHGVELVTEAEDDPDDLDADDAIFRQLHGDDSGMDIDQDAIPTRIPFLTQVSTSPSFGRKRDDLGYGLSKKPEKPRTMNPPAPTLSHSLSASRNDILNAPPSISAAPNPCPTPNGAASSQSTKSTLQHYGFTPAGRSTVQRPSLPPSSRPNASIEITAPTSDATPSKSRGAKASKPKPVEEPVWGVKRLEADKIVEDNGAQQRWFRVRWEGDWPADQNPTWEPEENIAQPLINKYLKKKARKVGTNNSAPDTPQKVPRPLLSRKYSSVAEAFAGEVEAEAEAAQPNHPAPEPLDGREEDMQVDEPLLVTEQQEHQGSNGRPNYEDLRSALAREFVSPSGSSHERNGSLGS
ncbi:hypothetical protein F4778DRAFT_714732 [Xylariomycetidae sp. FL2044]|nr:hypothetical protein F4778DRAFT_714732 [Xylariomycetidae sp. FL2044]